MACSMRVIHSVLRFNHTAAAKSTEKASWRLQQALSASKFAVRLGGFDTYRQACVMPQIALKNAMSAVQPRSD